MNGFWGAVCAGGGLLLATAGGLMWACWRMSQAVEQGRRLLENE